MSELTVEALGDERLIAQKQELKLMAELIDQPREVATKRAAEVTAWFRKNMDRMQQDGAA